MLLNSLRIPDIALFEGWVGGDEVDALRVHGPEEGQIVPVKESSVLPVRGHDSIPRIVRIAERESVGGTKPRVYHIHVLAKHAPRRCGRPITEDPQPVRARSTARLRSPLPGTGSEAGRRGRAPRSSHAACTGCAHAAVRRSGSPHPWDSGRIGHVLPAGRESRPCHVQDPTD